MVLSHRNWIGSAFEYSIIISLPMRAQGYYDHIVKTKEEDSDNIRPNIFFSYNLHLSIVAR